MQGKYIVPLVLGLGTGVLIICVVILLHKLMKSKKKNEEFHREKDRKLERKSNLSSKTSTPTIVPKNIPGFMVPKYRNVRIQEPLRNSGAFSTGDISSDDCEVELLRPRSIPNIPISTVMKTNQSPFESRRVSLMEPVSPLTITDGKIYGSISLQDLNTSTSNKPRSGNPTDKPVPCLKFALYYSVGNNELNVTVLSLQNLAHVKSTTSTVHLCVWVQVQFSKYNQEFRTSKCLSADETIFNETCVVSDFPVEHFTGSKISFRVIADESQVIAEAVYIVAGLPPSFPRNETIELQRPGIIQSSTSKNGEILLRLKYDPVDESVMLGIVECRGLRSDKKKNKLLDTYVKVQVIFANEIVQRFKSQLITKNNNPQYKKTLKLAGYFSRVKMTQTLVKITVVVKSLQKYNLGFVMLGRSDHVMTSGYQHWESIIDKPQLEIVQWHPLISSTSSTP